MKRQRWVTRGPLALVVLTILVGAGVAVWEFWGGLPVAYSYSCSRSGQRTLESAEQIIREHVSDASDFEVRTYDCDSGGPALLGFSSSLAPAAVRDALLTDQTCRSIDLDYEEDGEYVECGNGRHARSLILGRSATGTEAELYIGD